MAGITFFDQNGPNFIFEEGTFLRMHVFGGLVRTPGRDRGIESDRNDPIDGSERGEQLTHGRRILIRWEKSYATRRVQARLVNKLKSYFVDAFKSTTLNISSSCLKTMPTIFKSGTLIATVYLIDVTRGFATMSG